MIPAARTSAGVRGEATSRSARAGGAHQPGGIEATAGNCDRQDVGLERGTHLKEGRVRQRTYRRVQRREARTLV